MVVLSGLIAVRDELEYYKTFVYKNKRFELGGFVKYDKMIVDLVLFCKF